MRRANARHGSTLPRPAILALLLGIGASAAVGCGGAFYEGGGWGAPVVVAEPTRAPDWRGIVPGADVTSVQVFYDELAPFGTWESDPRHGYVFAPTDRHHTPYANGRWVRTEYGLTWVSSAPFGWATAHYGRWFYRDGWRWAPDTRWGPAWVQWRQSDDGWVGWAPLGADRRPSVVPFEGWRFVPKRRLFARHLAGYYVTERQLHRRVAHARPVNRWIQGDQGRHYVAGPDTATWRAPVKTRRFRDLSPRYVAQRARAKAVSRASLSRRAGRAHGVRFSRAPIASAHGPSRATAPPQRYRPRVTRHPRQRAPLKRGRVDSPRE